MNKEDFSVYTHPVGNQNCGWVTIELCASVTGYSAKAIRNKIARNQWKEGRQFLKAPDGRIFISISGVVAWINGDEK